MALRKSFEKASFPTINITNLVDVALTMVVVLLMISPFIEQGIDVTLPKASPRTITVEKSLVLTVAKNDVYYFGGRKVALRELYDELKTESARNPTIAVIVKGDETILYKDLVRVLDLLKRCNITKIGLATRVE